jgi:hypothetical protein
VSQAEGGPSEILISIFEGAIIAIFDYAVQTVFEAMRESPAASADNDFIGIFQTEWGLIIFVIGILGVVDAERRVSVPIAGAVLYSFGWILLAVNLPIVSVGWVSFVIGWGIVIAKVGLSSGGNRGL